MVEQEQKKWKREFSAGGIVYKNENNRVFVLCIKPAKSKRSPEDPKWTFPKGHIGDNHMDESPEDSALREVKEEGGVEAKIIKKLGDIKYSYTWDKDNIFKIVSYFLMEYVSGDPEKHDHEVEKAEWLELNEVENRIHWPGDKEIFNKAKQILQNAQS